MWDYSFSDVILRRAYDYMNEVKIEKITNDFIEATVNGTFEYDVTITYVHEEIDEMECTCPYAESGQNCKHMAAVLYVVDEYLPYGIAAYDASVDSLINSLDENQSQEILRGLLKSDFMLMEKVAQLMNSENSNHLKQSKREINLFYETISNRDYIDSDESLDLSADIVVLLDKGVKKLLSSNEVEDAFDLTTHALVEYCKLPLGNSIGETSMIVANFVFLWDEIFEVSTNTMKNKMLDWFWKGQNLDIWGYLKDELYDYAIYRFEDRIFIPAKLTLIDETIKKQVEKFTPSKHEKEVEEMIKERISLMKKLNMTEDDIDAYCISNNDIFKINEYYIKGLIAKGNHDIAFHVIKEAKINMPEDSESYKRYSLMLKDLYENLEMQSMFIGELWDLVLSDGPFDKDLYHELKNQYDEKEWINERNKVIQRYKNTEEIYEIYFEEQMYEDLINILITTKNYEKVALYEEVLIKNYEKKLLELYEMMIKDKASKTGSRSHYEYIVTLLRRIKRFENGEQVSERLIKSFYKTYRKRPLMIEVLDNFYKRKPVPLELVVEELEILGYADTKYIEPKSFDIITDYAESSMNTEGIYEALEYGDYLRLPDSSDIREYHIMKSFAHALHDEKIKDDFLTSLSGAQSYRKFKDTLNYYNLYEEYRQYFRKNITRIVKEWCKKHNLDYE